ncbi:sialidase-4-like [Salarias fasciatus]|uniref:exo-alpha-sialidase n=1 Tax=Salarias fasciatus TaxID=181472 RepID=A0A672GJ33_SALFA|nr:sialidase-4-like [Salarias fasciatus]
MDRSKAALALQPLQDEPSAVFKSTVYRIPSLLYERESKTLLAFAEERKTASDATTEKLVMRRGTLKDSDGKKYVEWSPCKPVNEAKIDGYRPMNPCPVYDKKSKTLFLFFICIEGTFTDHNQIADGINRTRLCFITSKDLGETWSSLTKQNDLTDKLPEIKHWATFAVGPGHGLQTEKGRLIIPVHAYPLPCCSTCCFKRASVRDAHARCLYSDDGKQWKFGKEFKTPSGECEMAEFFDGDQSFIYCNARNNKGPYRVEALSADNGESFEILSGGTLVETRYGCQGSVVAFPAQTKNSHSEENKNQWLLFSHPTNKTKRKDLGVYLNKSPRDPKTWSKPLIINEGPSGYSDLAYVEDGWFVCLVECGKVSEVEQIGCKVFHYSQIDTN